MSAKRQHDAQSKIRKGADGTNFYLECRDCIQFFQKSAITTEIKSESFNQKTRPSPDSCFRWTAFFWFKNVGKNGAKEKLHTPGKVGTCHPPSKNAGISILQTPTSPNHVAEVGTRVSLVLGQKPPGQKPPGHKPPDKNPLDKNPPCQKPPRQNILFRNFITFVFRMSYGKENLNLVFSCKIRKAWVYKVVHGWHNLMVGWWFLKEPFWVA